MSLILRSDQYACSSCLFGNEKMAMPSVNKAIRLRDKFVANFHGEDFLKRLLFLAERGYEFNETFDYMDEAERKQAIEYPDALFLLKQVSRLYEIYHRTSKKLFPKSLKMMSDVLRRNLLVRIEENLDLFFTNFYKGRGHLVKQYEDFSIKAVPNTPQLAKKIVNNDEVYVYQGAKLKEPVYIGHV